MQAENPHPHKATWRRSPHRVWLRRAVFQVHLWVGLLLTLYAIVIGVSGSALVFRTAIERWMQPEIFNVTASGPPMSIEQMVDAIQKKTPGWRVASLKTIEPNHPVNFILRPEKGAPSANYRSVVIDQYTGRIVSDRMRFAGVLGFLTNLHFYLVSGKTGLRVSGSMALGLVVLCLTGLVVWWPGVRRSAAALFFHRRRTWQRYNYDGHAVTGFWFAMPLLLLCLTGVYFAFPDATSAVLDTVMRSHPAPEVQPLTPKPGKAAPLTIDQAFQHATHLLPPEAPIGFFSLPAKPGGTYYAVGYYRGAAPFSQLVSIQIDGRTGQQLSREDTRDEPRSRRLIQYVFALHFGSFAGDGFLGNAVRCLWVLIGISPAVLAVTGVVLFLWRKRHVWRRVYTGSLRNADTA